MELYAHYEYLFETYQELILATTTIYYISYVYEEKISSNYPSFIYPI